MKKLFIFLIAIIVVDNISAQQKRIYLAPDDHTDYMWSSNEEGYKKAFLNMIDYYIRLNDSTAGEPYPYQSKWNCDGSFWVFTYEKNRSPQQFSNLIRQMKEGKITVPLNTIANVMGIAPAEATIRDMYYAGSLERRFGVNLELAINMEDQVMPLGLSSLWAGAGAKYSWKGVCACATKVKGFDNRQNEIYWYKGLDDQKVLMKWYSKTPNNRTARVLGGYAEARDPKTSISLLKDLMKTEKYPYHISGAFGKGWDDLQTTTDEFITIAKNNSDSAYQVIVSNEIDFFTDFEKEYGKVIPTETVSYGSTEWGNSVASLAEVSASVKRAIEKLRIAEGIATLVALHDKSGNKSLNELREKAWLACGLYFEHDWTADGPVTRKQRADWQRKIANDIKTYVDTLYKVSSSRLGEIIAKPSTRNEAFFVYNPLGWVRNDYCDYPYSGSAAIKIFDIITTQEVPFQLVQKNGLQYVRLWAHDVPSLGYKVFEIRKGASSVVKENAAKVSGGVIENGYYRLTLTTQGTISGLFDKVTGTEIISPVNKLYANDLGSGIKASTITDQPFRTENEGPVSVSLVAESYSPVKHLSRVTLFKNSDRIELENYITQNVDEKPLTYTFSFNLSNPEIWHEEAGAILKAKPLTLGGHYADSICRLDWLALNHFLDISGKDFGVTLSNRDAYFMKTGNSTITSLDITSPQIKVLATGQIDKQAGNQELGIQNQDGDSYFENFFAFKPYCSNYNAAKSMRFSLEHQNPLVAGAITGKTKGYGAQYSLLTVSNPNVLVWVVKPAEEGIEKGIILRVWNLDDKDADCTISADSPILKAFKTTHVEVDGESIAPVSGTLKTSIGHNLMETFRVFLK